MTKKEYSIEIGGRTLTATFTDLAEQANGSVLLKYGNTLILATAVISKNAREGIDFFPLTVEYEEKFYASGRILGSRFVRREGKPSDEAILSGRIVDRTIRPLFDQWIRNEVQVIVTVLSIDEDDPDVLAVIGASLALGVSDIPWNGPVSALRIAKQKNSSGFALNPNYSSREHPELVFEIVACGKDGKVTMIECSGNEAREEDVSAALAFAVMEFERLQEFQRKIQVEIGKAKRKIPAPITPEATIALFEKNIAPKLDGAIFSNSGRDREYALKDEWLALHATNFPDDESERATNYFEERVNNHLHREEIDAGRRPDGRGFDDIRSLFAQAGGISTMLHGSGIFYRGGTHILSALTLGGPGDSQVVEGMEAQTQKRFMHHYNFPPFSTGETGRVGGTNRRMIGHGALAEKALLPVIPAKEKFPYTIRIVSEALASNGSTSMGSVSASTLALMDAGVPISRPVAGIASGLMMASDTKYRILTDIQGPEDHHGDMDLKVAGTEVGITAIQMDVKVSGVTLPILQEALEKARRARLAVLKVITDAIPAPRAVISPKAPKIITLKIKPEQIGLLIGPSGKTVNGIRERTNVEEIDIEDDGTIFITGKNGTAEAARDEIVALTHEYLPGERFTGEVVKILDFGAFVKIAPNTEGLIHVSEIAPWRVDRVESILKVGDTVPVVLKEIDEKKRLNFSIKKADPNFFQKPA